MTHYKNQNAFRLIAGLWITGGWLYFACSIVNHESFAQALPPYAAVIGAEKSQKMGAKNAGYPLTLQYLGKDAGQWLKQRGIYLNGRILSQQQWQVSGGLKKGGFFEGFIGAGIDFDLQTLLGIRNAVIHTYVGSLQGQPYYSMTGSALNYNRAWVYGDEFRLAELTWEQTFLDKKIRILAGRSSLSTEFNFSPTYCTFAYAGCANPSFYIFDKSSAPYLTGTWGTTIKYKPVKTVYIKTGIWQTQSSLMKRNHNNWPGKDWAFGETTGMDLPVEIGYVRAPMNYRYSGRYDIGAFWDTAPYIDQYYNTQWKSRGMYGGIPKKFKGRTGIYLQAEQVIWRPSMQDSQEIILFGGADWRTGGYTPIQHQVFFGVRDIGFGTISKHDTIGIHFQYLQLSQRLTRRLDDTFKHSGFSARSQRNKEFGLEIDYGFGLAPGIQLMPFMHYSWNPDQLYSAHPKPNVNHAMVTGLVFTALLNQALGLHQKFKDPF